MELPPTVLEGLERKARAHGVSVESLICAIVVRSQRALDDDPGADK